LKNPSLEGKMYQFDNTMGCGQAVRHLILDQRIVGSNPTIPAK
jgi:hypothetical protein